MVARVSKLPGARLSPRSSSIEGFDIQDFEDLDPRILKAPARQWPVFQQAAQVEK